MSWFADLAGKAENLLNNLDEQTGVAIRKHNTAAKKVNGTNGEPNERHRTRITKNAQWHSGATIPKQTSRSHSPSKHAQEPMQEPVRRRHVTKKTSIKLPQFNIDACTNTLVADLKELEKEKVAQPAGLRCRRNSLPEDLKSVHIIGEDIETDKIKKMHLENSLLKKEHSVLSSEFCDALAKLKKTEEELKQADAIIERLNHSLKKENYSCKIEELQKKVHDLETSNNKFKVDSYESEIASLRSAKSFLEEQISKFESKFQDLENYNMRLDSELRHSQATISSLENDLEKSRMECKRMESDWQAYKVRVKNMLVNKDEEIMRLQKGGNGDENKTLAAEFEKLIQEREELIERECQRRNECNSLKCYLEKVEEKVKSADRVSSALRDALREERSVKNKLEAEVSALNKEIKDMQYEQNQTLASLRHAIREKEDEIKHIIDSSEHSLRTTNTGDLNVADYNENVNSMEGEKIQYLTNVCIQKQTRIEMLIADNNMLRIQLEKLESKIKDDQRLNNHSVVQLHEGDARLRPRSARAERINVGVAGRFALCMKRYPVFRMFILFYMISLHFWVLTILLTSTPDNNIPRRVL